MNIITTTHCGLCGKRAQDCKCFVPDPETTIPPLPEGWHISELCERRDRTWMAGIFHWDKNFIKHALGNSAHEAITNAANKVKP